MMLSYHSFGEISQDASDAISIPTPIHYHTVQGSFSGIVDRLSHQLQQAEELYRVNPVRGIDLSSVKTAVGGIVL
jgi:hypothetical protein